MKLAGGEGAHNVHMARHLIDYGGVGFIQIDCGRIGGIGPAKQVADYAVAKGVTYRQSHLHLAPRAVAPRCSPMPASRIIASASIPRAPKPLALELTPNHLQPDRERRDRRARRAGPGHRDRH